MSRVVQAGSGGQVEPQGVEAVAASAWEEVRAIKAMEGLARTALRGSRARQEPSHAAKWRSMVFAQLLRQVQASQNCSSLSLLVTWGLRSALAFERTLQASSVRHRTLSRAAEGLNAAPSGFQDVARKAFGVHRLVMGRSPESILECRLVVQGVAL